MVREFSEEKRQEIFRMLDEIDNREWKSFMEWSGSGAEEYGDWPDKLSVSAYTRYVDEYHQKVLELNEMTRQRVNTVFENVAEIDARYAARMRECQEKIKEQIAMVHTMTEFMQSMTDGNPNIALITKGDTNGNDILPEIKDPKEVLPPSHGREGEKQPEVIVLDIPEVGMREESIIIEIIDEAEAQGIISESEVAFMNQLMDFITGRSDYLNHTNGLTDLHDGGFISDENYSCLEDIIEQVSKEGDYDIFELRELARKLYTEIEKVIAERSTIERSTIERSTIERSTIERYVNEDFLRDGLGWDIDAAKNVLGGTFIEDMRELMLEYGLTDEKSINFFLLTISIETGNGVNRLENREESEFGGLSYTYNTRGAGLIQLTGPDQREFLRYLLNQTEDEEILNRYIDNFQDIDPSEKNEIWDNPLGELNPEGTPPAERLPPVAEYIAENYLIESALWYWCVYNKIEINGDYISLNECIETYNGNVDDEIMYLAVQCAVNGSEFNARGLGRFLNPENSVTIENDEIVLIFADTTGDLEGDSIAETHIVEVDDNGNKIYRYTTGYTDSLRSRLESYNEKCYIWGEIE